MNAIVFSSANLQQKHTHIQSTTIHGSGVTDWYARLAKTVSLKKPACLVKRTLGTAARREQYFILLRRSQN